MALIPDDVKEQIRQSISLPEVLLADGVRLTRKGRTWRGPCPFCGGKDSEKFSVFPTAYKCHGAGCDVKGDIFKWIEEKRGVKGFRNVLQHAAALAGISIEQYLVPDKPAAPEDPRKAAVRSVLGAVHHLAQTTADALSAEARRVDGIDLTPFVTSGEVGRLPAADIIRGTLTRLGFPAQAIADAGLDGALDGLADGWVLWARTGDRIIAGRPLDARGPIIGERGPSSRGWIMPRGAGTKTYDAPARVATDDRTYLALRALGATSVFRAVAPEGITPERALKTMLNVEEPPILLVRPTPDGRKQAFREALRFVRVTPRTRVAEVDPLPVTTSDAARAEAMLARAAERAGTVFDWQVQLLATHGYLGTPTGRQQAAEKLSRIVAATDRPVERAAYRLELESLTGEQFVERPVAAVGRHAPSSGTPTGTHVGARRAAPPFGRARRPG